MPLSSNRHWEEFYKTGEITSFMLTDTVVWRTDRSLRDRYPKEWWEGLDRVSDTFARVTSWVEDFSDSYLHTFRDFEQGMIFPFGDYQASTLKSSGRTMITLKDKSTLAQVTLIGSDPADKVYLDGFFGTEKDMKKIFKEFKLNPTGWVPADLTLF